MKKEAMISKINGEINKSQTHGVLNTARNLMITSMVSGTAAGMAMDVTSKAIDGVAYAVTGEGLTGKGKVAGLVVSAAAGVYVGVKAGRMTDYLIHQYEDDLASRDASAGLTEEPEEEETVEETESTESDTSEQAPEQK